jgi:tetratricopeptide (TPR) repeat protein
MRIFVSCVAESIRTKQNYEAIKSLEAISTRYPLLLGNNNFNELLGSSYLLEMRNGFTAEKIAEGEKFRKSFEDFLAKHAEVGFNHYLIGEAYSAAAVCYFRKGNSGKAKILLNKGLEISPNNYELTTRKRMIN